MAMSFEVEQKFRVVDLTAVADRLRALGALPGPPQVQVDRYFAHPARDFARTDEALRLRQAGERCCITYKGPKLDVVTKTRREIELPLPPGAGQVAAWSGLLEALGFTPVLEVRKHRRSCHVVWDGAAVEVVLDQVDDVGDFVELELAADEDGLDAARTRIQALAAALGLTASERRSYLELLLEAKGLPP